MATKTKKTKEVAETKIEKKTRADLMAEAQKAGVKNFRVLNRAELEEVLKHIANPKTVVEIVDKAVARWKAGWGKGKEKK